jgi:YidC/Oxa1 family membrane protein insertase
MGGNSQSDMKPSAHELRDSMRLRTVLIVVLAVFCSLCGWLVIDSGIFAKGSLVGQRIGGAPSNRSHAPALPLLQQTTQIQEEIPAAGQTSTVERPQLAPVVSRGYEAVGGAEEHPTMGSTDPESGFMLQLDLDSRGAAIRQAAFSKFKNLKHTESQVFLRPVLLDNGQELLSMANSRLVLVDQRQQLALNRLSWRSLGVETDANGVQTASFEASIVDSNDRPILRLTKSYRLVKQSYLLECNLKIDNLTGAAEQVRWNLIGPLGLEREDTRQDMRTVVAAFVTPDGQINVERRNRNALKKGDTQFEPPKAGDGFRWIAVVNKYFAAILVPVPDDNDPYCKWAAGRTGVLYNPDSRSETGSTAETMGIDLSTANTTLGPAGQEDSSRLYAFQLYLGPEDNSLFERNELYRKLGFVNTINFRGCCCPTSIINPLAFGILAIMKWMHGFWPHNYGIVIIILVFLMRLILHPITKLSQVSMAKMGKLAPRAEEIKKKYAANKTEMNKKLMELYREQGASPIIGFLPMFVQMPVWIALWSAINTSVDLRGAAFLPFWITDLSAPDALISWPPITIPLLGWKLASLNLLPILMGVAFYFQQKLMPTQAAAATNPQMAQQQKMMNIMMPLLFPLMLYNGPSGVNLYIMASTFAGVVEQQVIRKHIRQKEEEEAKGLVPVTSKTGGKVKKKKPKPFYRF